jgi:hypothetical protein
VDDWEEALKPPPLHELGTARIELRQAWMALVDYVGRADGSGQLATLQYGALAGDLVSQSSVFEAVFIDTVRVHTEDVMWHSTNPVVRALSGKSDNVTSLDDLMKWSQAAIEAAGGQAAVARYSEEMAARMMVSAEATARFVASWKALLILGQAYQDSAYRLLNSVLGKNAGGGTMKAILVNPINNPVGAFIDSHEPNYRNWFASWNLMRNAVKAGAYLSYGGPQWNPGAVFNRWDSLRFPIKNRILRLTHAVEAVEYSTQLAVRCLNAARMHDGS